MGNINNHTYDPKKYKILITLLQKKLMLANSIYICVCVCQMRGKPEWTHVEGITTN